MALHNDLLEQAYHLALREPRRPRQASLRRAVSSAYYALYHLLVHDGTRVLAPPNPGKLRLQVRRAFAHSDMKAVCQQFALGDHTKLKSGTQNLVDTPIEAQLASVAEAFVTLQEQRHRADYDVSRPLSRFDVLQKVDLVQQAFADWNAVRGTPNAKVFLAALLLQRHWNR